MERDDAAEVVEVVEGIYRIKLPTPPVGSVNAYLFRDSDAFDLLDTGLPSEESVSLLKEDLVRLGVGTAGRLRNIFLSHAHKDHWGAAPFLIRHFGARAFLGRDDLPAFQCNGQEMFRSRGNEIVSRYRTMGFPVSALEALPSHFRFAEMEKIPAESATPLSGGEVVRLGKYTVKVMAASGHTPGSLCFHLESERILFSSDALMMHTSPRTANALYYEILTSGRVQSNPLKDYLGTLEKLSKLDAAVTFPGHGKALADHRATANECILQHRKLLESTLKILEGRSLTCYETSEILFGRSNNIWEIVLRNIAMLSHLLYLKSRGTVVESLTEDGMARYLRQAESSGSVRQARSGS